MSKQPESLLSHHQSHRTLADHPSTAWGQSHPAIECGSLVSFLPLLTDPTLVLLAPLTRRIPVAVSSIWQYAVHLTTCTVVGNERVILYATFAAAEHSELGGYGCLLFPCREKQVTHEHLSERAHELQDGLLWCLTRVLENHPLITAVPSPARYRLPDAWVWCKSSLADSPITFTMGHWTLSEPSASFETSAASLQHLLSYQEGE